MKVSLEVKLKFCSKQERYSVIEAMKKYSALVRYGIKCLRPNQENVNGIYDILTEKFITIPSRTVTLAVKQDITAAINGFAGLQAKNFPLSLRFDKDNAEFFIEDKDVKVKMAINRLKKHKLTHITAKVMLKRSLTYNYYKKLFASKKGYKLPFMLVMRNGQIYAKITIEKEILTKTESKPHLNVGIDLNAFWIGKGKGHPLAVAFLKDDGTFARQPFLIQEWAEIPQLIRKYQQEGKRKTKKVVTNQIGLIIKKLIELTKNYDVTFKLEDLNGLTKIKGPYSKFFYTKFQDMLETKALQTDIINPARTSTDCSRCGKTGRVERRTFYCNTCYPKGVHRDINAAINIAKR